MNIEDMIARLAEINASEEFMKLGDELRNERRNIVKNLVDKDIIVLGENGEFRFNLNEHRYQYIEAFEGF